MAKMGRPVTGKAKVVRTLRLTVEAAKWFDENRTKIQKEIEMSAKFGTAEYNGKAYILLEQASLTNSVFPGWWGDAQDGESYTAQYGAYATDGENNFKVIWQFDAVKGQEPEDEGDYPWDDDHITQVIPQ